MPRRTRLGDSVSSQGDNQLLSPTRRRKKERRDLWAVYLPFYCSAYHHQSSTENLRNKPARTLLYQSRIIQHIQAPNISQPYPSLTSILLSASVCALRHLPHARFNQCLPRDCTQGCIQIQWDPWVSRICEALPFCLCNFQLFRCLKYQHIMCQ